MDKFENILINLRVLQSLQCHVRLDTTGHLFRIHATSSWVPTFIKRWWAHQTRLTDITRIQTLYKDARQLVDDNHPQAERIKTYLVESRSGLSNLRTTYRNDPTVVALMDVIIDDMSEFDTAVKSTTNP